MRMYTVYRNPRDFPGKIVARGFMITEEVTPDPEPLYVGTELREARRRIISEAPDAEMVHRHPDDDPVVEEIWL
jgi:hypothetical protein